MVLVSLFSPMCHVALQMLLMIYIKCCWFTRVWPKRSWGEVRRLLLALKWWWWLNCFEEAAYLEIDFYHSNNFFAQRGLIGCFPCKLCVTSLDLWIQSPSCHWSLKATTFSVRFSTLSGFHHQPALFLAKEAAGRLQGQEAAAEKTMLLWGVNKSCW